MARGERDKLIATAKEKRIKAYEYGIGLQFAKRLVEIALAGGIHDMKLLPERTRRFLHIFRLGFSIRKIRIHEHPDFGGFRD